MTAKQWVFTQLDTWFFRESRPSDSIGGAQLSTVFPPSARTIAGAIRTYIGEQEHVNWELFNKGKTYKALHDQIGIGDDLGQLQLIGPYLIYQGERLYPVPLTLLKKEEDAQLTRLRPGDPVECDLGYVRLPELETLIAGAKPIDNAWLTAADLERVLRGENPSNYHYAKDLFDKEQRLGIGIHPERRTVEEGLLYQNQHVRIRNVHLDKEQKLQFCEDNLKIGVIVTGIKNNLHHVEHAERIRLGGEGRLADIEIHSELPKLAAPNVKKTKKITLTLLTPANLEGNWLPEGFTKVQKSSETQWEGTIHGVKLNIITAVLGKALREGGWDLANQKPRDVISLIPAGSVWFCNVKEGDATKLHGYHIGIETALGRGEIAVGIW